MKLISLSGLDGSGKSTQIELLKNYLKSQGKSFYYFHAVEFSVAYKVSSRKYKVSKSSASVTKASWSQIQLRKIALLIDIFRFRRLAKKLKADYIISDRYFYDSIINIKYLSGSRIRCGMTKWIEKFIPKPDSAFYFKVSPQKIMQRERKPDQGMEYLVAKEKIFEQKIKSWDMIVVDGERGKTEIFEEIKRRIKI